MVSLRQKKTTVSAIRQPISLNLESLRFSQYCLFSITAIAFKGRGAVLLLLHRFPVLALAGDCVCPLALPIHRGSVLIRVHGSNPIEFASNFHVHKREV
jgi:hypothetical protein